MITIAGALLTPEREAAIPIGERDIPEGVGAWALRRFREEYAFALLAGLWTEAELLPEAAAGDAAELRIAWNIGRRLHPGDRAGAVAALETSPLSIEAVAGDWRGPGWGVWGLLSLQAGLNGSWLQRVPGWIWTWTDGGAERACPVALALDFAREDTLRFPGWEARILRRVAVLPELLRLRTWEALRKLGADLLGIVAEAADGGRARWRGMRRRDASSEETAPGVPEPGPV